MARFDSTAPLPGGSCESADFRVPSFVKLQIAFQICWYLSVQADEASWSSDQRRPNDFDGQKPQTLSDGQWSFHTLFSEMNTKISLMTMFHGEM